LKYLDDGSKLILFCQSRYVVAVVVIAVVVIAVVVVAVVVVAVVVVAVVVVASQANTTVQLRTGQGSSTPVFC